MKKSKSVKPVAKRKASHPVARKKSILKREGTMPSKKIAKSQPARKIVVPVRNAPSKVALPRFMPTRRKLTAAEIREFKQLLLGLRERLSGQIKSLKSDSLKRQDEVNTVEDGTDAFERQFALNIASTENSVLLEIEEALHRVDEGTFGVCEMSGEPIELERLKALPYARYSLATQSEMEKGKAPRRQSSVLRAL